MTVRALPALAALLLGACSGPGPEDKTPDQAQVEAASASSPARVMAASDYVKTFYAADPA